MISKELIAFIETMKHSPSHNYVIPGLTSWLIGTPNKEHGCIRMFTMSRDHEEPILPHSHRFDFRCLVLRGSVRNRVWHEASPSLGDLYEISDVSYEGVLGKHIKTTLLRGHFAKTECTYGEGQEYSMKSEEFHSIFFSRNSAVLFFEGPNRLVSSRILEPVAGSETIPLFKTEPWMFKGAAQ